MYVVKRHPAVLLALVCLIASTVSRILLFPHLTVPSLWMSLIWPIVGAVLYALTLLIGGREMLYKTAVPVWLLSLCSLWQLFTTPYLTTVTRVTNGICVLLFALVYTATVSGRISRIWLLLMEAVALISLVIVQLQLRLLGLPMKAGVLILPSYLMLAALLLTLLAMRVHTDGSFHPTWGDRADGRLIRSTPPIDRISSYFMVSRNGANNLFAESVEVSEMERYIHRKRQEGLSGFGVTHVFVAAYVRTVAKYPALNRFVAGQKVFSRGEDISVSMTVKKEMTLSAPDTVIKVHFSPADTAEDVYRKFSRAVEEAKNTPLESGTDNAAGILTLIPGVFLKFVIWLLKALDYFGLLPGALLEFSPFHGSAYFTSMASLGIRPVYHHLYDFGNIPVFCSFGKKRKVEEIADGQIVTRKYIDLTFNLDERICDGYYYASLIKYFLRILRHPEVLDLPPEEVVQDIH